MTRVMEVCGLCIVAALALVGEAPAGIVVLDPDAYANGTDISNGYAGATLSAVGTDPANASVYAHGDALASTAPNVFAYMAATGIADQWYPHPGDGRPYAFLRADFANATDWVAIDMIGNDPPGSVPPTDYGALHAYDAGGNLLATAASGGLLRGEVETVSITRPTADIAYVLASGYYPDPNNTQAADNVHLDRLQFDLIPEPATLGLLLIGAASLLRRRRGRSSSRPR